MASMLFRDNDSHQDYDAAYYCSALRMVDTRFTTKVVKCGEEEVILVNVTGVHEETGKVINTDLWPRCHATKEDLANLPASLPNFRFRIGFWENPRTGEIVASAPKHLLCHGERREFEE